MDTNYRDYLAYKRYLRAHDTTKYLDLLEREMAKSLDRPHWQPETSDELRAHARARQHIVTQLRLTGGSKRVRAQWQ